MVEKNAGKGKLNLCRIFINRIILIIPRKFKKYIVARCYLYLAFSSIVLLLFLSFRYSQDKYCVAM